MLDLVDHPQPHAPELLRPAKQVNPVTALICSLLCPGLGHLYIGLYRRANWIFGMELLCLLLLTSSGTLHSAAVLSIPSIYCFAFIDAYFAAREWNAGATYLLELRNPRIVAILNLLTKGLGYFYLGDRVKGIACIIVINAVQGALLLHTNVWTSTLAIALQIAIALDGYRAATQSLRRDFPELTQKTSTLEDGTVVGNPIDVANPASLQPSSASVLFTCICACILLAYIAMRALDGHSVPSKGTIEQGPDGLVYMDRHEKYTVVLPDTWQAGNPKGSQALFTGDGASIVIQEQYATYTTASMLKAMDKQLRENHPDATIGPCQMTFGARGAACLEVSYLNQSKVAITQRIAVIRRGLKLFIYIESWFKSSRPPSLDLIEQNLQL